MCDVTMSFLRYFLELAALDLIIAALIGYFGHLFAGCERHHRWLLPRAPSLVNTLNTLLVVSHAVDAAFAGLK